MENRAEFGICYRRNYVYRGSIRAGHHANFRVAVDGLVGLEVPLVGEREIERERQTDRDRRREEIAKRDGRSAGDF